MLEIPEVKRLHAALGCNPPLPSWKDIPDEFKRRHRLVDVANDLFFEGGKLSDFGLKPKPGVDKGKAIRVIKCCLTSLEPSHDHKEAGVAYMLSEWFEDASGERDK